MRLPVDRPSALGLIVAALATAGIGALAAPLLARAPAPLPVAPSGPAADYPMVLGAPFVVDGVTYTPANTMNYDQVGYAGIEAGAGAGITLAHRTLPLPSYVEVTSLKTGRTILARVERRGPTSGRDLVALSPAAAAQLGADGRTPVRVRRVNPPEMERALLRTGQTAPVRMDTPMPLVGVLLRKLDPALTLPTPPPAPVPASPVAAPVAQATLPAKASGPGVAAATAPAKPAEPAKPAAAPKATTAKIAGKVAAKAPAAAPITAPAAKAAKPAGLVVQVGAFSTRERAAIAARQVGGTIAPAGKLFRVRIAGLSGQAEAAGALAKARGAGYSDARIQRAD